MNYTFLENGAFFDARVKSTYTEIYIFAQNQYIKTFSIQKSDYPDVIGCGEKVATIPSNSLVPITLTEETIEFILKKYYGIGSLTEFKDVNIEQFGGGGIVDANQTTLLEPNIVPKEEETDPTITEPILLIDDVPVVFVKYSAIDCELIPEEEVEVEEVYTDGTLTEDSLTEEVANKKDYSKLIWMALAAAALAL